MTAFAKQDGIPDEIPTNVVKLQPKAMEKLREIRDGDLNLIKGDAARIVADLMAEPEKGLLSLQYAMVLLARMMSMDPAQCGTYFEVIKSQIGA